MQRFHKKNIRWTLFALGMYALLFVLVQTGVINFYYESTFINIMINIIYAVGLNLILGVAGQFSLGHAGFIAIGSYSGAILGKMMNGLPGLFAGMAVGVVISCIRSSLLQPLGSCQRNIHGRCIHILKMHLLDFSMLRRPLLLLGKLLGFSLVR